MLTDDIRSLAADIISKADDIDALPSGGGGPITWPTGVNLIGGTVPPTYNTSIAGDGDSGGFPTVSYDRRELGSQEGSVYVFGDSIIQPIPESLISPFAVNFGIGGQSFRRLSNRIKAGSNPGLATGSCGIILSGVNDMTNTSYYGTIPASYSTISYMYGQFAAYITGTWIIVNLVPCVSTASFASAYNTGVAAVNAQMATDFASSAADVHILSLPASMLETDGSLKASCAHSDLQHLSKLGCKLLGAHIYAKLQDLGINP